jgi:signal transduction histidine kinase/MFS family permease
VLGLYALLLLGAAIGGLAAQRAVLLSRLDRQIDNSFEQERRELEARVAAPDPVTGRPSTADAAAIFDRFLAREAPGANEAFITFVDGRPYKATPTPLPLEATEVGRGWASLRQGQQGEMSTAAGPVRYMAVPLQHEGSTRGVFVVASFLASERREIDTLTRTSGMVALLILMSATAAAWVVAGRLLRPVSDVTRTARQITETDLTRRIPVEGNDEIAELGRTFNAMLDRLGAAFETQRNFVDDAGHELRTPITIVRGHLELMDVSTEDQQETVELVTAELDRMSRIVDDLLLLAKAEQRHFVRPEPVELVDFTRGVLAKSRALGQRRWLLDATAEGTTILADPQRLTQAMLNLTRNAVEHTETGAEIGIGSARDGNVVRLWVRDRGRGVRPADRERIFERFARGRGEPRASDGAGLGLAIVRAVAVAHGGTVELVSTPGWETTFTIVIPVDVDKDGGAGASPAAIRPAATASHHDVAGDTVELAGVDVGDGAGGTPPPGDGHGSAGDHEPTPGVRSAVRAVVLEGFFTRLGFGIVTFALPLYALKLGLSLTEVGLVAGAKALTEPVVKPLVGAAVDRLGARRCYLAAVTIRFLAGFLLFTATSLGGLLAVRLLQGAASAARDPASITVLARQSRKRLGRTFSLAIGARDIANASAGVVGGAVLAVTGGNFTTLWTMVLVISVIPVLVVWFGVRDLPDAGGETDAELQTPAPEPPTRLLRNPFLRLVAGLGLLAGFTAHMTHSLFQVYAKEEAGLSDGQIGLIYSISVVGLIVIGPVAGMVADRYGTGVLAGTRGVANAVSSLVYVAFPSFVGALAGRMVDDGGKAAFRPTWGTLVAGAAQRAGARRGRVAASLDTALSIGEAAGPLVAGLIWDIWGFVAMFAVRAVLGVATELTLGRRLRATPEGEPVTVSP